MKSIRFNCLVACLGVLAMASSGLADVNPYEQTDFYAWGAVYTQNTLEDNFETNCGSLPSTVDAIVSVAPGAGSRFDTTEAQAFWSDIKVALAGDLVPGIQCGTLVVTESGGVSSMEDFPAWMDKLIANAEDGKIFLDYEVAMGCYRGITTPNYDCSANPNLVVPLPEDEDERDALVADLNNSGPLEIIMYIQTYDYEKPNTDESVEWREIMNWWQALCDDDTGEDTTLSIVDESIRLGAQLRSAAYLGKARDYRDEVLDARSAASWVKIRMRDSSYDTIWDWAEDVEEYGEECGNEGALWADWNTIEECADEEAGYDSCFIKEYEDEFLADETVRVLFYPALGEDPTQDTPDLDMLLNAVDYFETEHPVFCPWDVDFNGLIDPWDTNAIAALYTQCADWDPEEVCEVADVNDDHAVNPLDVIAAQAHYGSCFDLSYP